MDKLKWIPGGYESEDGFKALWGHVTVPNTPYRTSVLIVVAPNGEMLSCADTVDGAADKIAYWRGDLRVR